MEKKWKFIKSKNNKKLSIELENNIVIGNQKNINVMAGPCSVESWSQIDEAGSFLSGLGIKIIRGGCFKPRTSPYSFKGLELKGLQFLNDVKEKYNLKVITEVKDSTQVQDVLEVADIVQVGAKAMWDYGILDQLGKTNTPVMIKRSFAATTQECCQIAEYLLNDGNKNVIVCERGIRTFEPNSRFTLDLCGAAWIKNKTILPIVLDPSHAMGFSYGVPELSLACVATNPDGIMIETHPDPSVAKSDASQQLNFKEFEILFKKMKNVANAIGSNLV